MVVKRLANGDAIHKLAPRRMMARMEADKISCRIDADAVSGAAAGQEMKIGIFWERGNGLITFPS